MAKSKRAARTAPTGGSKSDYIRAHEGLTAIDLVAQAKREGITLRPGLVHTVRSATRRKGPPGVTERDMRRQIRRTGFRPPPSSVSTEAKLATLRRLVLEVGYDAATEVFAGVRADLGLG